MSPFQGGWRRRRHHFRGLCPSQVEGWDGCLTTWIQLDRPVRRNQTQDLPERREPADPLIRCLGWENDWVIGDKMERRFFAARIERSLSFDDRWNNYLDFSFDAGWKIVLVKFMLDSCTRDDTYGMVLIINRTWSN